MPGESVPPQNQILNALPVAERERLFPHLQLVELPLGKVLYESGGRLRHVYFPTDSIVSLLYVMENGSSAEIAVVGNEGIVGISLFMGGESTPSRAVVQSAGKGLRMRAQVIKEEFNRGPVLHLLLRPVVEPVVGVHTRHTPRVDVEPLDRAVVGVQRR